MLFNSLEFGAFFCVILGLFYALGPKHRSTLLLAASYFFYAWWDARFLGLIVLSTVVDFAMAKSMAGASPKGRKKRLMASIVVNLSILATFKYLGWFTHELGLLLDMLGASATVPVVSLILPVGLSFYTFQSMAYTIDVYRGQTQACERFKDFALFVAFFPQLVAGPIERSNRLLPQLAELNGSTKRQRAEGAHLMLWGYFKKVFIADNLAVVVAQAFEIDSDPSAARVLLSAYAFTWQIYCDFSGYTDIARGVAKFLGVDLSVNFRLPFFADGPQDLWRRWHISLSQWLRDYLYIPLGGNRAGAFRSQLNLVITMVLGGLWHGANWTFIVWGVYHGLGLALQRVLGRFGLSLPRFFRVILTFHFTCLGFLIFRARDMTQVGHLLGALLGGNWVEAGDSAAFTQLLFLITTPFIVELIQWFHGSDLQWFIRLPKPIQGTLSIAFFLAIFFLGGTYGQEFIYFQF